MKNLAGVMGAKFIGGTVNDGQDAPSLIEIKVILAMSKVRNLGGPGLTVVFLLHPAATSVGQGIFEYAC